MRPDHKAWWSGPARRRAVAAGGQRQRTSQVLCCLRKLQERKLQEPPIKPPKRRRTSAGAKTQHLGDMRAVDGRLEASAVAHRWRRAPALCAITTNLPTLPHEFTSFGEKRPRVTNGNVERRQSKITLSKYLHGQRSVYGWFFNRGFVRDSRQSAVCSGGGGRASTLSRRGTASIMSAEKSNPPVCAARRALAGPSVANARSLELADARQQ
jgi:hypothetical protein